MNNLNEQTSNDETSRDSGLTLVHVQHTSAEEWLYVLGNTQCGPVSEQTLINKIHSGELGRHSKIWKKGLPKWILVGNTSFREFLPLTTPPPLDHVEIGGLVKEDESHPIPNLKASSKSFLGGNGYRCGGYQNFNISNGITNGVNWYLKVLRGYAISRRRPRRKEHCMFVLVTSIVAFGLAFMECCLVDWGNGW